MENRPNRIPWVVRVHYRMRTLSFALLFLASYLQFSGQSQGMEWWLFLGGVFLAYPHVQYWRAARAVSPITAELHNLLIDSALLGVFIAAVQFSLWLSFSALLGTLFNNAIIKGWRGVWTSLLALCGGVLIGGLPGGFAVALHTDWPATLFCMAGLTGYLLAMGHIGFTHNRQIRSAREELKRRAAELLATNDTLKISLEEINGLQQQLRDQAQHDPLTGLFNRRYMDSTLERELARCKREGQSLSVIMIDIDHFKNVNDTYGHPAGDEVLRRLGASLMGMARAEDVACRYGGEEFLLLLPTMPLIAAQGRAEELRASFAELSVPFGSFRLQVTLSIGISVYPGNGISAEELIRSADAALYQAKQGGRNQVRLAPHLRRPAVGDDALTNLVKVVWHPTYDSGNSLIDEQHRGLFTQVNRLFAALLSQRSDQELANQIEALVRGIVDHFNDEEALIAAVGYPNAAAHAAIHAGLKERAGELVNRFKAGECEFGELFEFLAHDVIARHMLAEDRDYFPYLEAAADTGLARSDT